MDIDVIDTRDPERGRARQRWLTQHGAKSERVEVARVDGFAAAMVQQIWRVAGPRQVKTLRIWTDEPPSLALIADPAEPEHFGPARGVVGLSKELGLIHAIFGAGAHAELRGCGFGLRTPGRSYLQALARIWNVPVQAGALLQTTGAWRNPVVQAMPDGSIMLAQGTRIWSVASRAS